MQGAFKPIADLAQASLVDALSKLNGQTERMAAMGQFELFIEEAKESWAQIKEIYGEIQRVLTAFVFERKADEGQENDEWEDTQGEVSAQAPEDEEEQEYSSGLGDTSSG
jgi:hypothetical protein